VSEWIDLFAVYALNGTRHFHPYRSRVKEEAHNSFHLPSLFIEKSMHMAQVSFTSRNAPGRFSILVIFHYLLNTRRIKKEGENNFIQAFDATLFAGDFFSSVTSWRTKRFILDTAPRDCIYSL
jgi:hypothetical protein